MANLLTSDFIREVRDEGKKVTWPSRKETVITGVMVLIFSVILATFFLITDWFVRLFLDLVLSIGW